MIIDFSAVPTIESVTIEELTKVFDGINVMGCEAIVTGLRPDTVQTMVRFDTLFRNLAQTEGTLQKALQKYFCS